MLANAVSYPCQVYPHFWQVVGFLSAKRAKKNITQADLAKLAKVSRQTINAMELVKYVPSTVLALRLAQIFDVEVSQIFILEDSDWS